MVTCIEHYIFVSALLTFLVKFWGHSCIGNTEMKSHFTEHFLELIHLRLRAVVVAVLGIRTSEGLTTLCTESYSQTVL